MKKKKNKYFIGGQEPIKDIRSQSSKSAWESTFQTPVVADPNAAALPPAYDQNQSNRPAPSFLPDQYYTTKTEERGTGVYNLHPAFSAVNTLALATTGIAQAINNGKASRAEKLKYAQSLQNRFISDNYTTNDQPMYMAEGGDARKVDKVPDGYTFSHADGNRKFFTRKSASGQLAMATGSKLKGGADYEAFLQQQLGNGISPDELVAKKYISPDRIGAYSQYYKPIVDNVYTEEAMAAAQAAPTPQEAFMGDVVVDGSNRAIGRLRNRSRNLAVGAGTNDTGQEAADFMYIKPDVKGAPVDTTRGIYNLNTKQLQDIFGTGRVMTKDVSEYMKNSNVAKMPFGGGPLTSEGAKEMLRDGTAHGKKLTAKQKRYFGYIAGGGKPKGKYGIDNGGEERVEAEGGEVYTNQDQEVIKIPDHFPSHEEGGVPLNDVERVLEDTSTTRKDIVSKALKITPDKFQAMFGFKAKSPMSHSSALEKASKYYENQANKVKKGLEKATDILEKNKADHYATKSMDLNMKTLQSIPDENHVFDLLFEHQENVKDMLGVQQDKAKYGKYVPKAAIGFDDIDPYPGGKTKDGRRTPTGKDNKFSKDKEAYKASWKALGIDPDKMTNAEFQSAAYEYILANHPDVARNMWKTYGNTAKGLKKGIGKGFDFNNLNNDQLIKLKGAYVDGLVGARTLEASLPPAPKPEPEKPKEIPVGAPAAPVAEPVKADTPDAPFKLRPSGQPSRFNEPLRWYDVAGPLMNLTDSERIPANYNPAELNEVRLKLQNPTPALEAGNRDYNAALSVLPDSGAGMANVANTFASKYSTDNQVLGQYENANTQIKNQEVLYNAGIRDRQSGLDQAARATFEQQYLGSREAQRKQKLQAFDDLFTRVALNRKLNREGNLIMQLSPNFNQNGQYNGNQRYFANGYNDNSTGDEGITYITDPRTGKQLPILKENGKLQNKSKILYGLPK